MNQSDRNAAFDQLRQMIEGPWLRTWRKFAPIIVRGVRSRLPPIRISIDLAPSSEPTGRR
jgi:hypothetical protein